MRRETPLSNDGIDYQRLVDDALRDAVRRLLADVADRGIPGEHSFYLAFETGYPGVIIPRSLRDLYPEEMRIVLEHQFWNLEVEPDFFSVELSFSASRQRLIIPFAALTTFADPSAEFALRFQPRRNGAAGDGPPPPAMPAPSGAGGGASPRPSAGRGKRNPPGEIIRFDPSRRK
jgi:hypothetical protein